MTPAASSPGVSGSCGCCAYWPWRKSVSAKLIPIARLRISIVPLPASGIGASVSFRTSGPPSLSNWICFTGKSPPYGFPRLRFATPRERLRPLRASFPASRYCSCNLIRVLSQRCFDEMHPVVAPEHSIADEKGGCAECAARHRVIGVSAQLVLDVVALDCIGVHPELFDHRLDHVGIAD